MKIILIFLTTLFFSFGAKAEEETFNLIKRVSPKECVKALEKGKYRGGGEYPNTKGFYLLDGYMYKIDYRYIRDNKWKSVSLVIEKCVRSNRIY